MRDAVTTRQKELAGKYRPYPEYKDSGVELLGDIPIHWIVRRLKHTASIQSGIPKGKDLTDKTTISVPMLRVANVQDGYLNLDDIHQIDIEPHELERYSLQKGDVLMNEGGDNDKLGRGAVWQGDIEHCIHQNHVFAIRTENIEPEWLQQLMQSSYAKFYFYSVAKQSTNLASISSSNIKETPLLIPPKLERIKVLAFLNYETARIDRLIAQQLRLIELLKEKRQAVISHAVTKGLNPNAPMIDSGVEWLGQVPAHWVVRRLKHTAEIHSGIPKGKDLSGKDTITVPMLRVANVQDGYLNLDNVHEIEIEPHELVRYSLRAGDVLMNEGGDNDKLGRGAVWPGQITPCIHQNHVFAIRVNNIEPEWLSWLTSSSYAKYYFYSVSKQSTNLASISSSNVKETPLVLPPKNERVEIMRYLDEKIAKLSGIESLAALQIELLQERRTALISAAVTGKIDLRGWTQPAEEAAV
ncbi:type I restriction-modification protein subunit S [Aeromonas caviae]|nr:type I restriction-modification protein subunit S [Aeromonas caviae]GJA60294.1 type I restriction-modification protein subunit S [Aeromonas caviae]GJA69959.1 type I restriction-modification protein subunit S [Aeromonas caviae]